MGMALGRMVGAAIRERKSKKELEKRLSSPDNGSQPIKPFKPAVKRTEDTSTDSFKFQVYTHNVRLDTSELQEGEQPWSIRKAAVIEQIITSSSELPTLVGLQEVLNRQLLDIEAGLGPDWSYIGVGRDDGTTAGEYSPIFYNVNDWEVMFSKTYWLSETPDQPSKGWDADHNRVVTVGQFKHKVSAKTVFYYNTHFDHIGELARVNSANIIIDLVKQHSTPAVVGGDFNSEPSHEAYKQLSRSFKDSLLAAKTTKGPQYTNTTFDISAEKTRIDYIWVTKDVKVIENEVLPNDSDGSHLFSDHRPVRAVLLI